MAKGFVRGIAGVLALFVSTSVYQTAAEYKAMSPDEIATRRISDDDRQQFANKNNAIHHKAGPVYDDIVKGCREQETNYSISRTYNAVTVAALEVSSKTKIAFNLKSCIESELGQLAAFTLNIPPQGEATESYKNREIARITNGGNVAAALGVLLLITGACAFVRSTEPTPS